MIDVSSAPGRDPVEDFATIRHELARFPATAGAPDAQAGLLARKPQIVAANKIDALDDPAQLARLTAHLEAQDVPFYAISAVTGSGVAALLEAVWKRLAAERADRHYEQVSVAGE